MIGHLYFRSEDQCHPCFVLDAQGNLIRCAVDGSKESLIPYSVEMVTPALDVTYPKPWSARLEEVEERIRISGVPSGVYPEGKVPRSPYPFVPANSNEPGLQPVVEDALDLAQHLSASHNPSLESLLLRLSKLGIYPLPTLPTFNAEVHQCEGKLAVGTPIQTVIPGWFSNRLIYRKAVVVPAAQSPG